MIEANLLEEEPRVRRATKRYATRNVYDAAQDRFAFLFENFERIYLSFSGGKDSGERIK